MIGFFVRKKHTSIRTCLAFSLVLALLLNTILVDAFSKPVMAGEASQTATKDATQSSGFTNRSVELVDLRTENAKVFQNADGTRTSKVYNAPIHYKDSNGKYQDMDNTVALSTDASEKDSFKFQNKANGFKVFFADNTKAKKLYKIKKDNNWMTMSPVNANDVTGTTSDSTVIYQGVYDQVDLQYVVNLSGVKENLIINNHTDQNTFSFEVTSNNLEPKLEQNNSLGLYDSKTGQEVFAIPTPFAEDANGVFSGDVSYSIQQEGQDKFILTVNVSKSYLDSPDRKFPVVVDPSTDTLSGTTYDSYVMSAYPGNNYVYTSEERAGWTSSTGVVRSYMKFTLPSLSGYIVSSATLNLYEFTGATSSAAIEAHEIISNWSDTSITWNNRPNYNDINLGTNTVNQAKWYSWNVSDLVTAWYAGRTNNGIMIKEDSENDYYRKFYSSEASSGKPYILINYSVAPVPTVNAVSDGVNSQKGHFDLSWPSAAGASRYSVLMYNGYQYQEFPVGNTTSWSTNNTGINPTSSELSNGLFQFHNPPPNNGLNALNDDPRQLYTNAYNANSGQVGTFSDYRNNLNYAIRTNVYRSVSIETKDSTTSTDYTTPYTQSSGASDAACPTLPDSTPPPSVSNLVLNEVNGTNGTSNTSSITASWTGVTDPTTGSNSGTSYYKVDLLKTDPQTNNTTTISSNVSHLGNVTHSFTFTGQPNNYKYQVVVTTYDKQGNYSVPASTFYRCSSAYGLSGQAVATGTPRYETGKFGQALMVEEGTTNLFNSQGGRASQNWTTWTHWGNRSYWSSENQTSDPDYGNVYTGINANSAATYLFKYYPFTVTSGKTYTMTVLLKANQNWSGNVTAYINRSSDNGTTGSQLKSISLTTSWQQFTWTVTPNQSSSASAGLGFKFDNLPVGVALSATQLQFTASTSGDWTTWTHWGARSYWSSESQSYDANYGNVYSGVNANSSTTYLFSYYPYTVSSGQPYTVSVMLKASQNWTGGTQAYITNSSYTTLASSTQTISLTNSWQRFSWTMTPNQSTSGNGGLGISFTNLPVGVTLSAAEPQFEQLPYSTTYSVASRVGESATIPKMAFSPSQGTIEAWVKPQRNPGQAIQMITDVAETGNNGLILCLGTNGKFTIQAGTGSGIIAASSTSVATSNNWYDVVGKWDSTGVTIYVNGVKQGFTAGSPNILLNSTPTIGREAWANRWFDGLIDDFRISSVSRTDAEILANYNSGQALPVDGNTTYKLNFDGNLNTTNDNVLPMGNITSPSNNTMINGTVNIIGTASDDNFNSYKLEYGSGSSPTSWTQIATSTSPVTNSTLASWNATPLTDGTYTVRLTVTDKAGNSTTNSILIVKDGTLPTGNITAPLANTYDAGSVIITGTASDSNFNNFQVDYGAGTSPTTWNSIANSTKPVTNNVLATWNTSLLANGQYTIRLTVTDKAGNNKVTTVSVQVDNTKPAVTFTSPSSGQKVNGSVTIGGSGTDNMAFDKMDLTVTKYGTSNVQDLGIQSGTNVTWNWDSSKVSDGEYVLALTGYDKAGNSSSTQLNVKVENIPVGMGLDHWGTVDNHIGKVNIANGNFVVNGSDINLPGLGFGTNFSRVYNSQVKTNNALGWGWRIDVPELSQYSDGSVVIIDGDGSKHTYTVNADGSYTRPVGDYDILTKNADGTFTLKSKDGSKYVFDNANKKVTQTDKNNNSVVYQYDTNNRLMSITDPTNRVTNLTYDATTGKLTSVRDFVSHTWSYTYDANGNLIKVTDPLNQSEIYAYGSNHQLISYTDARGNATTLTFTGNQLTSITDPAPLSYTTTYTYDGANKQFEVTDARGIATKYVYDADLNVISVVDALNETSHYTYDSNHNLLTQTDALDRVTTYTYDSRGNLLTETDPLNNVTTYTYNVNNNLLTKTDAMNNTTSYTYDVTGNMLTDGSSSYSYNSDGTLSTATDANGSTTEYGYDSIGNKTSVTAPGTDSPQITSYAYDTAGNKTSETDPVGNSTTYSYDALGHMLSVTVPGTDSIETTSYTYDANGNRLTATDAKNNVTSWTYDVLNRVVSEAGQDGKIKHNTYDASGNVTSDTATDGSVTNYTYDSLNRQTQASYSDGKVVTYQYDTVGNRTTMTDSTGITTYEYDNDNNLIQQTDPSGKVTTYNYDALNRLIGKEIGGKSFTYNYGSQGTLDNMIDSNNLTTSFGYDNNKNRTGINYANGTKINYTYDTGNKVTEVKNTFTGGSEDFQYTYYDNGQGKTVTDSHGLTTYEYDGQNRLTKIVYPTGKITEYTYDAAGNRASVSNTVSGVASTTSYTYDADSNELKTITNSDGSQISYTYDVNGNTLTKGDSTGTTSYEYNSNNQLIKVTKPTGDVIEYAYDGNNRRISKTVNGAVTKYVYDGDEVSEETDDSGTVLSSYVYDYNGMPISVTEGGQTYNYHYNGHGDVVVFTDATGNSVATYEYDVWGNVTAKTGNVDSLFGYAGQFGYVHDSETGLYFLQSRYYDPEIGRFTTKDRFMGFENRPASQNQFTYCEDNPTNSVDPDGYWTHSFYTYLGCGSYISASLGVYLWNFIFSGHIFFDLFYKITAGGLCLTVGTIVAGSYLGKLIAASIVRNTFTKEILQGWLGATLGSFVFSRIFGKLGSIIASSLKYLDRLAMKIPYSTYTIKQGYLSCSFSW